MNLDFQLFPDAASTAAGAVDGLYLFLVVLAGVISLAIAGLVVFLAVRYRRHNAVDRTQLPESNKLELAAMAAMFPILMFIFLWGAKVCFFLFRAPEHAMPITVVAKQWMWKFQHANGRREIDALHVPTGQPVKLTMVSQDVIHSFFVPAFRVKQDVIPGRYTSVWFEATKPGDYRLYCAEYCGANHSRMVGRVIVQTPDDFAAWLGGDSGADEPPEATGQTLFEQFQCASCHRPAGDQQARGPALEGLFQQVVPLANGETIVADDAYLRESILRPTAKVVAGFQPLMPTYEGQISEEGVLQLIAYIKSLGPEPSTRQSPGESASQEGDSAREAESPPENASPALFPAAPGATASEEAPTP